MLNEAFGFGKQWRSVACGHGKRLLRSREAIGERGAVLSSPNRFPTASPLLPNYHPHRFPTH